MRRRKRTSASGGPGSEKAAHGRWGLRTQQNTKHKGINLADILKGEEKGRAKAERRFQKKGRTSEHRTLNILSALTCSREIIRRPHIREWVSNVRDRVRRYNLNFQKAQSGPQHLPRHQGRPPVRGGTTMSPIPYPRPYVTTIERREVH